MMDVFVASDADPRSAGVPWNHPSRCRRWSGEGLDGVEAPTADCSVAGDGSRAATNAVQ